MQEYFVHRLLILVKTKVELIISSWVGTLHSAAAGQLARLEVDLYLKFASEYIFKIVVHRLLLAPK